MSGLTLEMMSGSPCSKPPCRVKPHGAPPCSRASTSSQPPPPPLSPAARLLPLSMPGQGALSPARLLLSPSSARRTESEEDFFKKAFPSFIYFPVGKNGEEEVSELRAAPAKCIPLRRERKLHTQNYNRAEE